MDTKWLGPRGLSAFLAIILLSEEAGRAGRSRQDEGGTVGFCPRSAGMMLAAPPLGVFVCQGLENGMHLL